MRYYTCRTRADLSVDFTDKGRTRALVRDWRDRAFVLKRDASNPSGLDFQDTENRVYLSIAGNKALYGLIDREPIVSKRNRPFQKGSTYLPIPIPGGRSVVPRYCHRSARAVGEIVNGKKRSAQSVRSVSERQTGGLSDTLNVLATSRVLVLAMQMFQHKRRIDR